jgi:uncharacterized surface anchored protein
LEWGEYTLSENVPAGYVASGLPQTFTVTANALDFTFTATNTQILGSVTIHKRGIGAGPLAGAGFTLYPDIPPYGAIGNLERSTAIASGVTDENGSLTFANIPYGHYMLVETSIPYGYVGVVDRAVVIESQGQVVSFDLTNIPITGSLTLRKLGAGGAALAGAEFTLFKADGVTIVKVGTTGADGTLSFTGIPYGNYVLKETAAPEGYVLLGTTWNVVIDSQGKVVNIGDVSNTLTPTPTPQVAGETATPPPTPTPSPEVAGETALPTTGVPITYLFGIGGILLILGGIVLVVLKKSKKEDF